MSGFLEYAVINDDWINEGIRTDLQLQEYCKSFALTGIWLRLAGKSKLPFFSSQNSAGAILRHLMKMDAF